MSTITERVAKGAAFFDEKDPGWWRADVERAIDLDRLDFSSGDACLLGQRCPLPPRKNLTGYGLYGRVLSGIDDSDDMWRFWAELGITAPDSMPGPMDDIHDALCAEWKRLIEARRSA